jgi:amidophosphoribosyltransferase
LSGVFGIFSKNSNSVSQIIYYGLFALQHRGQISCGIAINNNGFLDYHKDLGLVHEVFSKDIFDRLRGNMGIGHVKYASSHEEQTQTNTEPVVMGYKKGAFALAFDGSIVNSNELRDKLKESNTVLQSDLDAEVIANVIAKNQCADLEDALNKTLNEIIGSYSLLLMTNDMLIGARDPNGLKPLSLGKLGDDYVLASESCAFDAIGGDFVRDIEPGEVVLINDNGIKTISKNFSERRPCLFELVYFARSDSFMDGKSIYRSRIEVGKQLARESQIDGDIVIGAPDSGIVFAIGYAEESKIPYAEGMIKNRYVGRTFIQPSQELREQGVRIKLNVLKENIEGKKVILVDDSIVRGTTIKRTVDMLREAGAKEIHVRIASPPVLYPCHLGMDTPSKDNLISANMEAEEIRELIGVDSLYFLTLEGLLKAIGNNGFCKGCFTGEYAVEEGKK